jgi:hypothetical protein
MTPPEVVERDEDDAVAGEATLEAARALDAEARKGFSCIPFEPGALHVLQAGAGGEKSRRTAF